MEPRGEGVSIRVGRAAGDVAVVTVHGEVDVLTAPQLTAGVNRAAAAAGTRMLVVDLTAVGVLGSAGLKALLGVRALAAEHGLGLRIVAGGNRHVLRPLEMTTLDPELPLVASLAEALAAGDAGTAPE